MTSAPSKLSQLKQSSDFDRFLAQELAQAIKQPRELDIEKLILEIKREINPEMHKILP